MSDTATTKFNEFHAEILDTLANAPARGYTANELSRKLTTWGAKHNLLNVYGAYNDHYEYWEIPARNITAALTRIAKLEPNLVKNTYHGKRSVLWQWKPTVEADQAAREAAFVKAAEATNRVTVLDRTNWDGGGSYVVTLDHNLVVGTFNTWTTVNGNAVRLLTDAEARTAAEALATIVRRSLVKAAA